MNSVQAILILIIRLWAASIIVDVIAGFPYFLSWQEIMKDEKGFALIFPIIFNSVVWGIVGSGAWVLAPKLAKMVSSKVKEDAISISIEADVFVMVGSFLIGSFYLAQYLPELFVDLGTLTVQIFQQNPDHSTPSYPVDLRRLIQVGSIVSVALFMAFRPAQLALIFSTLRHAGQYDEPNPGKSIES